MHLTPIFLSLGLFESPINGFATATREKFFFFDKLYQMRRLVRS